MRMYECVQFCQVQTKWLPSPLLLLFLLLFEAMKMLSLTQKRAKNASKIARIMGNSSFVCRLATRCVVTHTNTHTHIYSSRVYRLYVSERMCVSVAFLAYYTLVLQMHIVNSFGHKGKHTPIYIDRISEHYE